MAPRAATLPTSLLLPLLRCRFAVALDAMFRHGSNRARMGGLWRIFERPVNLSQIKDYEVYVPKERQMWLLKIKGRVRVVTANKIAGERPH